MCIPAHKEYFRKQMAGTANFGSADQTFGWSLPPKTDYSIYADNANHLVHEHIYVHWRCFVWSLWSRCPFLPLLAHSVHT